MRAIQFYDEFNATGYKRPDSAFDISLTGDEVVYEGLTFRTANLVEAPIERAASGDIVSTIYLRPRHSQSDVDLQHDVVVYEQIEGRMAPIGIAWLSGASVSGRLSQ